MVVIVTVEELIMEAVVVVIKVKRYYAGSYVGNCIICGCSGR